MLVVIGLIALVTMFIIPGVSNFFKVSLDSATRELASVVKDTYNSAVMTGRVHRLAYDLKEHTFWAESGPNALLLDTAESKAQDERRRRYGKKEEERAPGFSLDKTVTRKKITLPRGVEFEDVVTGQAKEPITEGMAYTHFFPHGLTEQTVIHLKDTSDHHITLVIPALLGRTRVLERYVRAEEAYAE
jgi:Tfp pilus assembly protein FimT